MEELERFERVFDKLFAGGENRIDWTLFKEEDRSSGFVTYGIEPHNTNQPIVRGCDTPLLAFETALGL